MSTMSLEQINNETVITDLVKTLAKLELVFDIDKVNLATDMEEFQVYLDKFLFPLNNMWRFKDDKSDS